jgi:hypothetical protein
MRITRQNKSKIASTCAVLLLSIILWGCAKPSIVGKWHGDLPPEAKRFLRADHQNFNFSIEMEFKEDGTYVSLGKTSVINITTKGTYKIEGGRIFTTVTDVESVPDLPTSVKYSMKIKGNKTAEFKLEGDSFTMTTSSGDQTAVMTMNRVSQ